MGDADIEKFFDVPPHVLKLKNELYETIKQQKQTETRLTTERQRILTEALRKIMISRFSGKQQQELIPYINRLQCVSGTKDSLLLCFNGMLTDTAEKMSTIILVTGGVSFVVVNGICIPNYNHKTKTPRAVELFIEKGIFDVHCALEKKMEDALSVPPITDDIAMEPVAKRSKLGGTSKTK